MAEIPHNSDERPSDSPKQVDYSPTYQDFMSGIDFFVRLLVKKPDEEQSNSEQSSLKEAQEKEGKTPATSKEQGEQVSREPITDKKPLRPIRFTSRYYYALTLKYWHWLMLSSPIDLVLLWPDTSFLKDSLSSQIFFSLWVFLVSLSAIFVARDYIINALLHVGNSQTKIALLSSRYSLFILGFLAAVTFTELTNKLGGVSISSLLVAALITIVAIQSIRKTLHEQHEHHGLMEDDRSFWIEQNNRKVFLIAMTPLLAARLASPIGILYAIMQDLPLYLLLLYPSISWMLLFIFFPSEKHFMIPCRGCGIKTSTVLMHLGLCPVCERRLEGKEPTAPRIQAVPKNANNSIRQKLLSYIDSRKS